MKVIGVGDIHFGEKCTVEQFVEYQSREFDKISQYAIENNIKHIAFLGDMFDNRKNIFVKTIELIREKFSKMCDEGFNIYIIVGNHDTFYKNTNSLNTPNELIGNWGDKIKVIDTSPHTQIIGGKSFLFMPWITKDNREECLNELSVSPADYCLGHFEINNFVMNNSNKCSSNFSQNMFKEFKFVFSGHFHTRSSSKNILYIGSNCQLDWNDFGQKKGFVVLDTETDTVDFIDSTDYIYYKVIINDKFSFNQISDLKDCFIKVYINRKLTKKEDIQLGDLLSRNISYEIIDNTVLNDVEDLDDVDSDDFDEIVNACVDAQENLDSKDKKAVVQLINHHLEEMKEQINQ